VLPRKVSKFPITSILCVFPDSVAVSLSRVLRDRRQSESKSVSKILPRVRWVPTIITSSLFIGFEGMGNGGKWQKFATSLVLEVF
jgi:hypothetical protein